MQVYNIQSPFLTTVTDFGVVSFSVHLPFDTQSSTKQQYTHHHFTITVQNGQSSRFPCSCRQGQVSDSQG
ncbi:hypothetical protein SMACR_12716 [Sordaria macrospora]|uniref:Uncharacterized protein n=1 Tax=Sordaria macrospora TaxID=5147 RepID=A0A8S8ZNF2_SORMA|nr:hypothetical protein SMACR_12716 [Sordaria macrospora]WPJ65795.1 hypothetical protein SMAC4_12716 [Sordaria macrospora]